MCQNSIHIGMLQNYFYNCFHLLIYERVRSHLTREALPPFFILSTTSWVISVTICLLHQNWSFISVSQSKLLVYTCVYTCAFRSRNRSGARARCSPWKIADEGNFLSARLHNPSIACRPAVVYTRACIPCIRSTFDLDGNVTGSLYSFLYLSSARRYARENIYAWLCSDL